MSTPEEPEVELEPRVGVVPAERPEFRPYHHPAAGWGAAKSVTKFLRREGEYVDGPRAIMKMNHENGGFDCPGCAWPDDLRTTSRAAGYMPEMNLLCAIGDYSTQSDQPIMKHLKVTVTKAS